MRLNRLPGPPQDIQPPEPSLKRVFDDKGKCLKLNIKYKYQDRKCIRCDLTYVKYTYKKITESLTPEHSPCSSLLSKIILSFFLVKENWVSPSIS